MVVAAQAEAAAQVDLAHLVLAQQTVAVAQVVAVVQVDLAHLVLAQQMVVAVQVEVVDLVVQVVVAVDLKLFMCLTNMAIMY